MTESPDLRQFTPYFQPIVDVLTGEIGGYEALARQRTEHNEVISAWPFFSDKSVTNQQKLAVDRHVRFSALSVFARQHGNAFLSINISPSLMESSEQDIGSATLTMMDAFDIVPSKVVVEIIESEGQRESIHRICNRFHRAGLQVAIDDFGAGHSHMERLFDLKADLLKIDMNLFREAARGGIRADYLQALRYVTERNSIRVVCEGVETEDEFMFAMDCGARYIQGFLFSPAVETLLPKNTFSEHVAALRRRYLQQRSERLTHAARHRANIEDAVLTLKEQILAQDLDSIDVKQLRSLGVFRFFACTTQGEQISSNYNLLEKLTIDRRFYGYNWSTRPYFAELIALRAALAGDDHIIQSSAYKDQERQHLCRTYGIGLDENSLLLIDISEEDLLAYVAQQQDNPMP